jgi:hypothetical protein
MIFPSGSGYDCEIRVVRVVIYTFLKLYESKKFSLSRRNASSIPPYSKLYYMLNIDNLSIDRILLGYHNGTSIIL